MQGRVLFLFALLLSFEAAASSQAARPAMTPIIPPPPPPPACIQNCGTGSGGTNSDSMLTVPAYGNINTIAGDGTEGDSGNGGSALNAELTYPNQPAVDSAGNIYIPDAYHSIIRKVSASTGIITTIAGTGQTGLSGNGGLATDAELAQPEGVAIGPDGNLYVADTENDCIREVNLSTNVITDVAGICAYTPEAYNGRFSGDGGPATRAQLNDPVGVVLDSAGNIYISDQVNQRIRKVTAATGIITTMAGNGGTGYNGDNQLATSAELNSPAELGVDGYGNIYFADILNNRVRAVSASTGIITTIAGTGVAAYLGDGGPAIIADLNWPNGIAVDPSGDVYIADFNNNRVREVSSGNIKTVAGDGTPGFAGDGGLATSAELKNPNGVALDGSGNLYISDTYNQRIRSVGNALESTTFNPAYKVVSILYSPPGNQSFQGYSNATTNGTTTTVGSSFSSGTTTSFSAKFPQGGPSLGGSIGYTQATNDSIAFTQSFTNTQSLSTDVLSETYYNPTGSDDINHHLDMFEIWLNPLVTIESSPNGPVTYSVQNQPVTINGIAEFYSDIIGEPAVDMEASQAGVTEFNPTGAAGVTTVPLSKLIPQAYGQPAVYEPGLAAICSNNSLYLQQLQADLANPENPAQICTQGNQCGCTPADFAPILEMDPLLWYDSSTYTGMSIPGTESPLEMDGSGIAACSINAPSTASDCRYVPVPQAGTNTPETASLPVQVAVDPLSGDQYPGITLTDSTTTTETLGSSQTSSTSLTDTGGLVGIISLTKTDTWSWTDSESIGNIYGQANTMSATFKTSNVGCMENVSIYEDTIFHTFAFQVPTASPSSGCKGNGFVGRIISEQGYPVFGGCPASVTLVGGGGSGATAVPECGQDETEVYLQSITVTSGGSGYTSAPTVYIDGAPDDNFIPIMYPMP